jgi:GT2 family glycosyltransferase
MRGEVFLRSVLLAGTQYWIGVVYVPLAAERVQLDLVTTALLPDEFSVWLKPVSRTLAACLLAIQRPLRLARALLGQRSGVAVRVRATLASVASGPVPTSYPDWAMMFDTWSPHDQARLLASPRRAKWPTIGVVLFGRSQQGVPDSTKAGTGARALSASQESLARQILPCRCCMIGGFGNALTLSKAISDLDCEYVALLEAGEVLPAHALAVMADEVVRLGRPTILYADEDEIAADNIRRLPQFKPEPNHALMLSGTLSRGVWLVRRDLLAEHTDDDTEWAEVLRLKIWLREYERGRAATTHRIPYILVHRRPDTRAAPPGELARVVNDHFVRAHIPGRVEPGWPLRVEIIAPPADQSKVSIVVPSACRAPHVARCLNAVLSVTRYANFEVVVVISQSSPLDAQQTAILRQLEPDPRFRYIQIESRSFNYAAANNAGVAAASGALTCLLNDDVAPQDPDWLARMVGHLLDPRVGAVGARLDYPNGVIQHGGVIIGLAGLCEHTNRFLPSNQPGYCFRAIVDQEVSAVTGACLLVRRALYDAVGGLDVTYASAFNDVDFCLKIREARYAIVLCATTRLTHYESLSYGRHYSGESADERESKDVNRMVDRWSAVCEADPFHNPNLALQRGNEWALAFPPRVGKPPV